ncbi:MAG: hypothetical protein R2792_18720 [Saprospiraceae bacterium]
MQLSTIRIFHIISISMIILLSSCAEAKREIVVEKNCEICEQAQIDFKVRELVISDKTYIHFTIGNKLNDGGNRSFTVHPPGTKKSFFIVDSDSGKRFNLLNVEGVPVFPQTIELGPNESRDFNLTFEKLNSSSKKIHIIGGEPEEGQDVAQFMGIDLE